MRRSAGVDETHHVEPTLARLLRRQESVITRWQAMRFMSAKAVRHLLDAHRWRRLHRGVFLAYPGPTTPRQRDWAAVLAFGADRSPSAVCLSGLSGLCAWGLQSVTQDHIDVLVSRGRRARNLPGAVAHHTAAVPDLAGGMHLSPPAAMPGRSLLDAVQWARSDSQARLCIAASFQQGLVTFADVERATAEQPYATRRLLLLRTATDCAGGSHSLAELDLLSLCRRERLPRPTRQVRRRDRRGRSRYLDASFDPWKVAVEVDGGQHLHVGQMWDDAVRDNELQLDGYVVLRFPAFAIRDEPSRVAADIRRALRNAGWRG